MVIAHNLSAQNAQRMYGINNNRIVQSIEKLSSGYRINRSADDAAGLAISEKMRAQIRGLNRASLNALDGISVIQTAEGAFGEMQAMLHRINELCTQAANDTNTDVDRKQIQQEIDQLVYEIDDTTDRTQFNTKKILSGINRYKNDGTTDTDPDAEGVPGLKTYNYAQKNLDGVFGSATIDPNTGNVLDGATKDSGIQLNIQTPLYGDLFGFIPTEVPNVTDAMADKALNTRADYASLTYKRPDGTAGDISVVFSTFADDPNNSIGYYSKDELVEQVKIADKTALNSAGNWRSEAYANGFGDIEKIIRRDYGEDIKGVSLTTENGIRRLNIDTWADQNDPFKMMLQVGALPEQGIEVEIEHLNARGLGITGIFVDSYEDACKGMKKAQEAIDKVSTARAALGAQQNRLEHTIKNLDNIAENTQAAESRLRDTDMAKLMVEYTRNLILAQVGEAMMANSRNLPEAALQLLI